MAFRSSHYPLWQNVLDPRMHADEPAQVCILNSSVDGSGMSSITAFMLNGLILCLTTQTTLWKKALLYISLHKQTNLANLLSCLTLWFACCFFLK